jgi:hypothetical protein
MIAIRYDTGDIQESCTYRLQIDKQLVCKFEHNRVDGLADCLQKAADAVELSEWAEYILMNDAKGG